MFEKKPQIIECKYTRIRKPKKGELLVFQLPPDTSHETLIKFKHALEIAQKNNKRYIVISGELKVTCGKIKKPKAKKG